SAAIIAGVAAFLKAVDPTLTNGMIVGRMARTADPAGTQEQTGNGRVNMARALTDTGTDEIQPAGADPVGDGGPFVGPYMAAANRNFDVTIVGPGSVTVTTTTGTVTKPAGCSGTQNTTTSVTLTASCTNLSLSASGSTDPAGQLSATFNPPVTFSG